MPGRSTLRSPSPRIHPKWVPSVLGSRSKKKSISLIIFRNSCKKKIVRFREISSLELNSQPISLGVHHFVRIANPEGMVSYDYPLAA
jgi:hypothetical protein